MKRYKNKNWILMACILAMIVAPVTIAGIRNEQVRGTDACVTDECKEAKAKAEEAETKADEAMDTAKLYEKKVQDLTADIKAQENRIIESEQKIQELKEEIKTKSEDLNKKQEALAEMLVNIHFDNSKEPIRILASSNSISDLAEKASREQVAQQQVSTAAGAVRDAKEKLESDQAEVEKLLDEQEEARQTMIANRKEQKEIQKQYETDADEFAATAKEAREKQIAAEKAYREANPEVFTGGYYASTDAYPFQNRCPQEQDEDTDDWGMYICECVSYAAWQVQKTHGYSINWQWGSAYNWDNRARELGFTVDNNPEPNTVGQSDWMGPVGHVWWVESVDADGINISEYNGMLVGDFTSRKIYFPEAYSYNYIHF